MELLTQSNAILGTGQMSLAKYLFLVAREDAPGLDVRDVRAFLEHLLARVDLARDLHFHVNTTIDTLDYSGTGLNLGSKLVVAAAGEPRRRLGAEAGALGLPGGFGDPRIPMPGVVVVRAPPFPGSDASTHDPASLARFCDQAVVPRELPLVVLVDDSAFASRTLGDFLWVTFTRSNPAVDVSGTLAFTEHKGWGCNGSLVIDARAKPHHAPPLVEDPAVSRAVDALGVRGRALQGWV
jgi:4-hydroxy-3-polyprenylbenzoate decarboxylase